ncbi:MAG: TonB-dependent receptor [Bryobacterales bacterium]|nr:TonB-dependent receptor [Bryobacterales bacterium]
MVSSPLRLILLSLFLHPLSAQTTASLSGTVLDSTGQPVPAASVRLTNRLSNFEATLLSTADGAFRFANLPFQPYTLEVTKPGFQPWTEQVPLRQGAPRHIDIRLELAASRQSVTVSDSVSTLVDPEQTGSYAQMNQREIERLPLQVGNRGLEAVLATFPGFAQNANGAIHPRGAHNQMTFVIDGMPVSDQLTGAFANAVDPNIVQSVELFTGNIPAEYGNKVAAVANITTKSGIGSGRLLGGSFMASAAQFDTAAIVTQFAGERGRWGYSGSANLMKSNRYLDQVSLDNLHNGGNSERIFLRADWMPDGTNTLRFNVMAGRSSFQLANLRSQHAARMDSRQLLQDVSGVIGWVRTLSPRTVWDTTASFRSAHALLLDSPADTPVAAWQSRRLDTWNIANRLSRSAGPHRLRAGLDYQRFPVRESFRFAITDPKFNNPEIPGSVPNLTTYDLTRGGSPFYFREQGVGRLASAFVQDSIQAGRFQFVAGLRYDSYRFLSSGNQLQPRLGMSVALPKSGTVLRLSYNRTFQPPPNENLLMSSSASAAALVDPSVRFALGGAFAVIRPERQNFYEAGLQQPIGRRLALNVAVYHKDGWDQQDNNSLLNTPIIFPTSLARIRVNAAEGRLIVPEFKGFSGTLSMTHYRAISTPPFTGGLFLGNSAVQALSQGPFLIDHDQTLAIHSVINYTNRKGWFGTASIRYDSGLVTNPSNPAVVALDPDYSDLLPYVKFETNPIRTTPRTVADVGLGYQHSVQDRRRWEAVLQISNLTNVTALYNFQSLFVGTRLVQPRTFGARLRWFF